MNSPATAEKTIEEEIAEAIEQHAPADEGVTADAALGEAPAPDEGAVRGPDGKFAAKEASPEEQPAAEPAVDVVIPDKYALAPNYAKKAIREKWAELPGDVRQEMHERETEFHKQLTRFDEDRNFGKQIKQVVAPYEPFINSLGANPAQAVEYLIQTDYALRTSSPDQRRDLFLKAARDYGIDLSGAQQGEQQPHDPQLETLQQRISRLEQEQQSATQATQFQVQQDLERHIEEFASNPAHVFFDRVAPVMSALLQNGQASDLDQAYDMAIHADPETRALQLAAKQQTEQSQRSQASTAAAQRAKAASVSVTGAPGLAEIASSPSSAGSLEDDIRAAIAAASGRF